MMDVRDQYERYPYPVRNPDDEKVRIENCWHDFLEVINFYCFKGKQNFSGPFRVLVAGGGTGDQTIFLAEQLRHNHRAEIVHLDFSANSIAIAKRRAEVRRLTNIRWLNRSLLDVPSLALEPFDYINCVGVLHHLKDPSAGLHALTSVLNPNGAMMIMLYGKYGRTGVYQVQELLRRVNRNVESGEQKIENTKRLLASLPKSNWFMRGRDLIGDHTLYGDAGIYDVFLHAQDRPFTVPEIYELVNDCGLRIIEFIDRGRAQYMAETYIADPNLRDTVHHMPKIDQQAIAELIAGDLIVHNFYVARSADTVASIDDVRNVPFYFLYEPPNIVDLIDQSGGRPVRVPSDLYGATIEFMPGPYTRHIFEYLDGQRCLKEIFDQVRKDVGQSADTLADALLLTEFMPIYERFNNVGWMLLRHRSVGTFRSLQSLQRPPT